MESSRWDAMIARQLKDLEAVWPRHEALEAYFGRFRVIVNGVDRRGHYAREAAEQEAAWHRGRGRSALVRDGKQEG